MIAREKQPSAVVALRHRAEGLIDFDVSAGGYFCVISALGA